MAKHTPSTEHFMSEVSSSREEPVDCRNQLGRWTGRASQDDSLMPKVSQTRVGHHTFTPNHMTDVYSQKPLSRIPITILDRQMDTLRAYVCTVETDGGLPAYDGWNDIPKFDLRVGDMGE